MSSLADLVAEWGARGDDRFHHYVLTESAIPDRWTTGCFGCSALVEEWVYPCLKSGADTAPPLLLRDADA